MSKILTVAWREFSTTVFTKAFLLGLLLPPVLMVVGIAMSVLFSSEKSPAVKGTLVVWDQSGSLVGSDEGLVVEGIRKRFTPEALREAMGEQPKEALKKAAAQAEKSASSIPTPDQQLDQVKAATELMGSIGGTLPVLDVEIVRGEQDVKKLQDSLTNWKAEDGGRVALAVIPATVVAPPLGQEMQTYDFFTAPKVDVRASGLIKGQIQDAVVEARLTQAKMDPVRVRALTQLAKPQTREVTKGGEARTGAGAAQFIIPFAFFMLLWIASFSGAGQLLNNTIEEKSNRIMEVLLSAVSPFQLMFGKILGQMGAGFVILAMYASAGVAALIFMERADMIQWWQIAWLIVLFISAYLFIASMFAAIGSAVSDIQEANSLMTPAMLVIMIPMFAAFPIIQNPSGMLGKVLSFVPPFCSFAMVARVASTSPPPQWEIALSVALSLATGLCAVWIASKIFRIGVLMYGKPPNIGTLIKWVRMA
jgi:ABC-2 type transport system permease protein